MSCRTTPAGSAWTTIARLESGLTDVQTLSTFHALRREGHGTPAPTQDEWRSWTGVEAEQMAAAGFSAARQASLTRRMERAYEQTPDGPTWYALRNIRERARSESSNVETQLRGFASITGETYEEVNSRYHRYLAEVDRGRSVTAPEGYESARDRWRQQGLPADHGTYTALSRISLEAMEARAADGDRPRRVEQVSFPNSRAIASAGYDVHDGRLEVVFRRRDRNGNTTGVSRTYAYRGVPQEVWADMCGEDGPGSVYNQRVRNHSEYRYESVEDEETAAHRRCGGCGQWWAPGHTCPARTAPERTPETATAPYSSADASETGEYAARIGTWEEQGLSTSDAQATVEAEDMLAGNAALADLRTRLADDSTLVPEPSAEVAPVVPNEPDPAPEPEPVDEPTPAPIPERPEPRTTRSLGISSRWRRINVRRVSYADPSRSDSASLALIPQVRAAAVSGPVALNVSYSGYRYSGSSDGLPNGYFSVTGTAIYDRPTRGQHTFEGRDLQCTCLQYQENYDCPHVNFVLERYRQQFVPTSSQNSGSGTDPAAAQAAAEAAMRQDWMRSEEHAAEARARHAELSNPQDSYTENFSSFEADHNAALQRKAQGEEAIPYMRDNALNGEFTRSSGRGFGVEMEFDFPSNMDYYQKSNALAQIGRELHEAGLTQSASQQGYHASARRGYTDEHQGGWSFEQDCTVSGEIVSPVMYDEPETWQNIEKVCEIVRRNGGIANAKTGSHVHVGAPGMTTAVASELMQMANQHEDIMYRLSQNPERPSHRPMRWCGPNRDVPQGGYTGMQQVSSIRSHNYGMNFGGVRGGDSDHPEIRYWDGTLSPAAIQAQVKVSTALVQAAERNASLGNSQRNREAVGSHSTRLQAVRGRSRRALTSEELAEDTATVRSFMDTLFTRREDKAQVASLFAVTRWQSSSR